MPSSQSSATVVEEMGSIRAHSSSDTTQVTVAVCVFAFDLLYWDGQPLVKLPLRERRQKLQAALPGLSPGHVQIAHAIELCSGSDHAGMLLELQCVCLHSCPAGH